MYANQDYTMKFEHLIEINDFSNPLIPSMTREQLWNGLVLRAEYPKLFIPHLDSCAITSRQLDSLTRTLQFGELKINDRIQFDFLNTVVFEVPAQGDISESTMQMVIEEPEAGALLVRFIYQDSHSAEQDRQDAVYDDFRRSAYVEADIDTIKLLRDMHAIGRLDNLLT